MTRIFLTKKFGKWSNDVGLVDEKIVRAITEIEQGLIDADLGGSTFKKRIGINGQGKSGSLRTIIGFKKGERAFFLYGFPKGEKDNITRQEKAALKEMAKIYFELNAQKLKAALESGALIEIKKNIKE
ncbi:MAG: hypothetical protein ACJAW8_002253 [Oleispira sp.]|uniref:type II toxin-antitoxin system RelE/ParE family toxin n=1 Tax=Neptuniibacter marinus TaxID=1806670 RepID=UPI003AEAA8F3